MAIALHYLYLLKIHPIFLPHALKKHSPITPNLVDLNKKKHSTRKLTKERLKIDSYVRLQHSSSLVFDREKDKHLAKFGDYLESQQIYAFRVGQHVEYFHFRQLFRL